MDTTVFLDAFTGGAASIDGRTPDTASPPTLWVDDGFGFTSDMVVDGAGSVHVGDTGVNGSANKCPSTSGDDLSGGFVVTADMQCATMGTSSNSLSFEGHDIASQPIFRIGVSRGFGGSASILCAVYDDLANVYFANFNIAFDTYFTAKIDVTGLVFSVYKNDVLQHSETMASPVVGLLHDKMLVAQDSGATTNLLCSRVEILKHGAAPVFWQNFVGTFEIQ